MALDLALLAAIGAGALAGWKRGFVLPLLTIAGTFIGLSSFTGAAGGALPSGTTGLAATAAFAGIAGGFVLNLGWRAVSLVHRVPILMAGDRTLGIPLGAATAVVGAYVALATVVTVDTHLAPLHGKPSIDAAAIALVKSSLQTQPELRLIADPAVLDQLAVEVATAAVPRDQLAKYDQTLAFYSSTVRPAVLSSTLGPLLIRVGELFPVVGRRVDYPRE